MAESDGQSYYTCKNCLTPLAFQNDLLATSFMVPSGRAYLFAQAMNISLGRMEERMMMTGYHTVANIYCSRCGEELGWKYLRVDHHSQKYKEGKFVLEFVKMIKET